IAVAVADVANAFIADAAARNAAVAA
ncbi:hypothetical protein L195_g062936, partial [Trifolium pratense]